MKLEISRLNVKRGGKIIVPDLSFSVEEGNWLMLVGRNGAGKSTALRAISCAIPSTGDILLDGQDVRHMRPMERALNMGLLGASNTSLYAFTVEELVSMGRYAHRGPISGCGDADGAKSIEKALLLTELTELRHESVLSLSSGERQRAFLAQVLCQEPRLLLLDEPDSHLDLSYTRQLYGLIDRWRQEPGRAVISVVHDLSAARRFGTHALLLSDGKSMAFGPAAEVLKDENLARAWGMDVAGWMKELASVW